VSIIQKWHDKYILGIVGWYFSDGFPSLKKLLKRLKKEKGESR
jgi:hypothetical protein